MLCPCSKADAQSAPNPVPANHMSITITCDMICKDARLRLRRRKALVKE